MAIFSLSLANPARIGCYGAGIVGLIEIAIAFPAIAHYPLKEKGPRLDKASSRQLPILVPNGGLNGLGRPLVTISQPFSDVLWQIHCLGRGATRLRRKKG